MGALAGQPPQSRKTLRSAPPPRRFLLVLFLSEHKKSTSVPFHPAIDRSNRSKTGGFRGVEGAAPYYFFGTLCVGRVPWPRRSGNDYRLGCVRTVSRPTIPFRNFRRGRWGQKAPYERNGRFWGFAGRWCGIEGWYRKGRRGRRPLHWLRTIVPFLFRPQPVFRRGPGGGLGGGRLKVGRIGFAISAVPKDLAVSASPQTVSFGTFLVRTQEKYIRPLSSRYRSIQPLKNWGVEVVAGTAPTITDII